MPEHKLQSSMEEGAYLESANLMGRRIKCRITIVRFMVDFQERSPGRLQIVYVPPSCHLRCSTVCFDRDQGDPNAVLSSICSAADQV